MAAKEKKEAEGEHAEGAEAKKPKSKKMLFVIIGVVLLLVAGGAGMFLMGGSPKEGDEAKKEEEAHPRVLRTAKLEPFIVNLSEAKSFLKVSMLLEYDPDVLARMTGEGEGEGHGGGGAGGEEGEGGGLPAPFVEKEAVIRDRIISVLSSKTPADVLSTTGKQTLKDEIIEAVNDALEFPEPVVVGLYFTEFMIQ